MENNNKNTVEGVVNSFVDTIRKKLFKNCPLTSTLE